MGMVKKSSFFILIILLLVVFTQPVLAGSGKININTATQKELSALKYVGDKIAVKMISYREAQPFEKPEDIMKVNGIGQRVYDANKDVITVKDEKK
ncbi:MAG: helix-hairpin-helix domain-containing protein [Pseudomonadota bacterium]